MKKPKEFWIRPGKQGLEDQIYEYNPGEIAGEVFHVIEVGEYVKNFDGVWERFKIAGKEMDSINIEIQKGQKK